MDLTRLSLCLQSLRLELEPDDLVFENPHPGSLDPKVFGRFTKITCDYKLSMKMYMGPLTYR